MMQHALELLNEAATLDPRVFDLFAVNTPISPLVGATTDIEVMMVGPDTGMLNALGLINGLLASSGQRLIIQTETVDGHIRRSFSSADIPGFADRGEVQRSLDAPDSSLG